MKKDQKYLLISHKTSILETRTFLRKAKAIRKLQVRTLDKTTISLIIVKVRVIMAEVIKQEKETMGTSLV